MTTATLTFDNGPTPAVTDGVLDVLSAFGLRAVFFVIGKKASTDEGRRLVRRALAEGHRVGAHTWNHAVPFGRLDDVSVRAELDDTAALLAELGGEPDLFRPYGVGGVIDDRLMSRFGEQLLRERKATCVLWNSLPGDWRDEGGWMQVALDDMATRDWSVVVLHDVAGAALRHLRTFLATLTSAGVAFSQQTPDDCTPLRGGVPTPSHFLLGVD
jgi:peptidoglycan-N-acetylglucosamine deacetylase